MRYHNITKADMLNGDGLRVVLWVAGCPHGCEGCHNPVTWDVNSGLLFDEQAEKEIFHELEQSYISGVTLSGGDPLHPGNRKGIEDFIIKVKQKFPEKTIWLYTGYLWEEVRDIPFIRMLDVLVDGRFEQHLHDSKLHWRGSSNQRVIDVVKSFEIGRTVLYCD